MTDLVMQEPWKWKRGDTNAIDSYVGTKDEPVLDYRPNPPILRIMDGVTAGGTPITNGGINGVKQPII
jgi:hypothetical protein